MSTKSPVVKWLSKPEEHDYPAAASYLSLIYSPKNVAKIIGKLKASKVTKFKAKDIFRASSLNLLGVSNSHVEKNIKKIKAGNELSPVLLVRDPDTGKVIIADGYHRVCAVYTFNEDALVPCKIY